MPNRRQQEVHRPDVHLRAWRAVLETYSALLPVMDAELRQERQLDVQTYDALLHVNEAGPSGIRMTELARKVVLTKSGLTARVDRLEETGLLRRIPDPDDRRATRITLTDQGARVFHTAAEFHLTCIDRHFSSQISDDEARTIAEALERVQQAIHPPTS
jgi:DNA-binding MarR family transcriptional regulator